MRVVEFIVCACLILQKFEYVCLTNLVISRFLGISGLSGISGLRVHCDETTLVPYDFGGQTIDMLIFLDRTLRGAASRSKLLHYSKIALVEGTE